MLTKTELCIVGWSLIVAASGVSVSAASSLAPDGAISTPMLPTTAKGDAAETPLPPGQTLEAITVTARRRTETLIHAPVDIVAIPQASLEQYGTDSFNDLATRVPGLVMTNGDAVLGPQISLRGIGTTTEDPTVDQSVSVNVDGLQLSQGYAYQAALFDVGEVQVLEGPQDLDWGKDSPAGVISIRTADPTDRSELIARTGYEAESQERFGELILSGPVSPWLKLRLAAHYSSSNGYFKNLDTAPAGWGVTTPTTQDFGADENLILRGTALFKPSDLYDARLKINFMRNFMNDGSGTESQLATCPNGLVSFTGLPVFDPNQKCSLSRDYYISWLNPQDWPGIGHNGVPFNASDQYFGSLEQHLYLGALTFTSVTGYYNYNQQVVANASSSSGIAALALGNSFYDREGTEEIRLSSNFSGSPLDFMVGGFYQGELQQQTPLIYGSTLLGLPPILYDSIDDIDIRSISGFAEGIWRITKEVELDAGARVTHETRHLTQFNVASAGIPLGLTPLLQPDVSSTDTSPQVTLTDRPSDDVTIYASYREGFKSGSFNTATTIAPNTPDAFGDEKVQGGEGGLKANLLDGHLALNLAVYDYEYSGMQVGANEVSSSGVFSLVTVNAAKAHTRGIELNAAYSPPQAAGLTVKAALNYDNARYDSFPNAPCGNNQTISAGCNQLYSDGAYHAQNLAGMPLVRAPDWTGNAGFDYVVPVGQDMELTFGGYVMYSSKYYTALIDLPGFIQHSFAKVSANMALEGPDDKWKVAIIGNNLTDRITTGFCFNSNSNGLQIFGGQVSGEATGGPAGNDYAACVPDLGRELWLRLTWRFVRR